MISEELDQRWQAAYAAYGKASAYEASVEPGDPHAAGLVSSASAEVARLWREIAAVPGLPWWVLAAVRSAAQRFEWQARERASGSSALVSRRGSRGGSRARDGGAR